ncbi:5'-nucleotidase [Rhizophagus irregularis DAOM 181602=DAOM 197198]|uniref:5'-nucleotidase n=2 Tax=Rhizophagus irregularis (strain DAOM 181602 / DAOM 197198 / MUCL 43194) TaxID=747089 RepID=A0A2P4PVR4_RHIID|nr:5'-nucleotidase [Rhizophagus irregularis DAOM 181602=DAOM 197198]POG69487.1 5'-nucleotidase [Rhizophagus irregularis DAOM 181602=DAOM 197198]CAG8577893.1 1854_t:CDS:2 [Rhizophagus irregularis]|eukprot:XP_025176353.1 5'-nucleotidase [Rhizophagus irregularis DAOM 181602=DAOM 197198]
MDKLFFLILILNTFFVSFLTTTFYYVFSPSISFIEKDELFNLTIIHTNDVHSRYDQINSAATNCTKEQYEKRSCYGGTARHKTIIDKLRKENKNTLLLDGGDQFQGTLFFTYYDGELASKVLNLLEYNITAIGNHEFDNGPEVLTDHFSRLTMPIVCANINTTLNPTLGKYIKPYHIFEEYDLAVIGYITETTGGISNSGPTLSFNDPIPIVQNYVDELHSKGIKRILTLSHNGYGPDRKLAARTHGVAVHVGGHSHSLLANDTTLSDYISGPYPTVVENAKGENTLVVQAFWAGKYIGHLDISLDKDGRVVNYTGGPILVDQSVTQDSKVLDLVEKWRAPFDDYVKTVIGTADDEFVQSTCQQEECSIGNLVTDAMLVSRNESNAALVNAGGLRAGLFKGNITLADINTVLPFKNFLVEIKMTGQNVTDMLESVVGRYKNKISNKTVTSFIQVSGIRFKYDSTKLIYNRVTDVKIRNPKTGIFEFIDSNSIYKILTNDFVSNTGDGIIPYPITDVIPLESLDVSLRNYISDQRTVKPYLDGRIEDIAPKHYIKPINPNEPNHFGYSNLQESINFEDGEVIAQNTEVTTKSIVFIKYLFMAFYGPFF